MASKLVANDAQELSNIVVDAVLSIAEKLKEDGGEDKIKIDIDNIKVEKKAGASIHDTQLIHGIILDKEVVHRAYQSTSANAERWRSVYQLHLLKETRLHKRLR